MSFNEKEPFIAKQHGYNKIEIDIGDYPAMELRPTEIHFNENGSIEDTPTFAILLESGVGHFVVGQISVKMFNEAIEKVGYKLIKNEEPEEGN